METGPKNWIGGGTINQKGRKATVFFFDTFALFSVFGYVLEAQRLDQLQEVEQQFLSFSIDTRKRKRNSHHRRLAPAA